MAKGGSTIAPGATGVLLLVHFQPKMAQVNLWAAVLPFM